MSPRTSRIELPPKLIPVFTGEARFRGAYGGRGSAKTRNFALMTAVTGYRFGAAGIEGQILCGREHLNSLADSSIEEVKAAIRSVDWLNAYYEVGEEYIRSRDRRIKYTFSGLRHNVDSLKSKSRILLAWIDEAERVGEVAWFKLIPTVREDGSEVWVTWNPESEESATHRRFRQNPPAGAKIAEMNWRDNPWFPAVLERDRREDLERRPDTYDHVWEGAFLTRSAAQIFAGKAEVRAFEPEADWDGPYFGLDFGFSVDPTAAVQLWIGGDDLYVRREAGRVSLELDDYATFLGKHIPGIEQHVIRADNARPENISHIRRHGLPKAEAVKKWQGSVEDGIEFMRNFRRIVVHPDCPETAREFRVYSYKVDRLSGDVLPIVVDANNHYIDAIRYALEPMIRHRNAPVARSLPMKWG